MHNDNDTPLAVKLVSMAVAIIAFVPVSYMVLARAAQIVG